MTFKGPVAEPLDLEVIERRLAKATLGVWLNGYPNAGQVHPMPDHVWSEDKELIAKDLDPSVAELIANAPTDLRALIQECRRLSGDAKQTAFVLLEQANSVTTLKRKIHDYRTLLLEVLVNLAQVEATTRSKALYQIADETRSYRYELRGALEALEPKP